MSRDIRCTQLSAESHSAKALALQKCLKQSYPINLKTTDCGLKSRRPWSRDSADDERKIRAREQRSASHSVPLTRNQGAFRWHRLITASHSVSRSVFGVSQRKKERLFLFRSIVNLSPFVFFLGAVAANQCNISILHHNYRSTTETTTVYCFKL